MNKRILRCGKVINAIGQEGSIADIEHKIEHCCNCIKDDCEGFIEYIDEYIHLIRNENTD